jgi:ATP-independent RNA helicase DbpA
MDRNAEHIVVKPETKTVETVRQLVYFVAEQDKVRALVELAGAFGIDRLLVFRHTQIGVDKLAMTLKRKGKNVAALHGGMSQRERTRTLADFKAGRIQFLVATNVASRGLDITDLPYVLSYDIPEDADTYVHRIGRTGRAGRQGVALTLCTPREQPRLRVVEEALGLRVDLRKPPLAALRANVGVRAPMVTLRIDGGRTDKLRPGDIVGALTGEAGLAGDAIGKIDVFATRSYVAIARAQADRALSRLQEGRIKAKKFRVRRL